MSKLMMTIMPVRLPSCAGLVLRRVGAVVQNSDDTTWQSGTRGWLHVELRTCTIYLASTCRPLDLDLTSGSSMYKCIFGWLLEWRLAAGVAAGLGWAGLGWAGLGWAGWWPGRNGTRHM